MKITSEDASPVFVMSAGWRSGSTLLQRLITASRQVLVWGEAGGALERLTQVFGGYEQMLGPGAQEYEGGLGGNGASQYELFKRAGSGGVQLWIPCMNAPLEVIEGGARQFLRAIYQQPAKALGYPRWGIKEVRSGYGTAVLLKTLFPDAKFLFLIRDPMACLTSLKRHNWMDRPCDPQALEYYAGHWTRLAKEFRMVGFGRYVRFEDFTTSQSERQAVFEYLGVPEPAAELVFGDRVKGNVRSNEDLTWWEKRRAKRIIAEEAEKYGYIL